MTKKYVAIMSLYGVVWATLPGTEDQAQAAINDLHEVYPGANAWVKEVEA